MHTEKEELLARINALERQIATTAIAQEEKDTVEKKYQKSQIRFKTIFEKSVVGKKIIDDQLKIIKINNALLQMLGYAEQEMIGKEITEFAHPKYKEQWKELQHSIWTTSMSSFNFETCLIKHNGDTLWVQVTTILIEDFGERLGYTIIEDISERRELDHLKKVVSEQQQKQEMSKTILTTQEQERERIAEGLHNGLGQMLFGIKLSIDKIRIASDIEYPGNSTTKNYTLDLISTCIHECRRISHNLLPSIVAKFGLKAGLEECCRQLSGSVKFHCHMNTSAVKLDKLTEVTLYRIVQELMMNILKHAQATLAWVDIVVSTDMIKISVKDNGMGLQKLSNQTAGIGLQMITSKVNLLDGSIKIQSPKGKGTKIFIKIPRQIN
jgi:PAS domain S-box-containing protein